ncbi:hypothetical protein BDV12DRAFT_201340 [Aspergillus spectabilis]
MNPYTSSSFFAEPPISIRVGSDKVIYYVHRQALTLCPSSALNARVTGPWRECREGEIDWTDFDEQTISCVLQFLYTQGYSASQSVQLLEKKSQSDAGKGQGHPKIRGDEGGPSGILAIIRAEDAVARNGTTKQQSLEEETAEDLIDRPLTPLNRYLEMSKPVEHDPTTGGNSSQTTNEGALSELLVHAKVYSFAHRYLVDNLVEFVLQRLKQILIVIQKKKLGFCPQLAESISLIYNATSGKDPARNLLSQFVALNYTAMYGRRLKKLLAEGGQFTIDLSWKLARRLRSNPLEERINELQAEAADRDRELKRLTRELKDWDDWNARRPSHRRRIMPSRNNDVYVLEEPSIDLDSN